MTLIKEFFLVTRADNRTCGHCKLCQKDFYDSIGSTGNLYKHMRRRHKKEFENWKSLSVEDHETDSVDHPENPTEYHVKINESILTNLIIKCNIPPSLIESGGFRQFMKQFLPKWKPSTARYLTKNILPTLYASVSKKIESVLSGVD